MQLRRKITGLSSLSLVLAFTASAISLPVFAQDSARFKLETTPDGYVRLDTFSGAMTYCTQRDGEFTCNIIDNAPSAAADEINKLNQQIEVLTKRVEVLEQQKKISEKSALPSEEEFEQTMGMMERFLKRFFGIVKSFDEPEPTDTPSAPNRT